MSRQKKSGKLGLFDAIMMGLGGAIGFEVFILLPHATEIAGSAVVTALLLCGIINLLIMFSYSELGAAIPEVGGEYTYTKAAFGGVIAFLAGLLRWMSSILGVALAAIAFVQQLLYLVSTVKEIAPTPFATILSFIQFFISAYTPLMAAIIILILMVLSIRGGKMIGSMIVFVFLAVFIVFILSGLWHGLAPSGVLPPPTPRGVSGVFAATTYTFLMFLGVRALVAGGPQIRDPGKNIPRAILLSAILIMVLYCGIAYVVVGIPLEDPAEGPLLNVAAKSIMGTAGTLLLTIAGIIAALSSISTAMAVQASIAGGLSRDGYLPKVFLSVHKRFGTRYVTIIISSVFTMLLAATGIVVFVGYAAGFASLLVFAFVNLSLMRLRKMKPYLERPFKAPLYPFTPIVGIAVSIMLLLSPVFLGEEGAVSAFVLGFEFIILALLMYFLTMVGYQRLRVAIGGINLGVGVFVALVGYLMKAGFISPVLPEPWATLLLYGLISVSAICIMAGVLNVTVRA